MARTHSGFDNHVVIYADTNLIKLRVSCAMLAVCWMLFMCAGTQAPLTQWLAHLASSFFVVFSLGKAIDMQCNRRVVVGDDLAHFRAHPWNEAGRSMFAHILAHEPTVRIAHIRMVAKAHVAHAERLGTDIDPVGARYFGRDVHEHMQGH